MKTQKRYFAPFIYSQISVTQKNIILLVILSLQIFCFLFTKDFAPILNIAVCIVSVVLINFLANLINKKTSWFNFSLITEAMLIAFCTPVNYDPIYLFILVMLSQVLIKILFSGYGGNIFSSIAFTIILLYISFPKYFPENLNDINLIKAHGNMLSTLQIKGIIQNDKNITSLLNYFFGNIGVVVPEGYATLLANNISTIPAFRYNLLTIFSSAFSFAFDIGDRLISFVFILVYGILVWAFGMYKIDGTLFTGDVFAAFCTTGIFFYAFFIVGESSTVPNSKIGKIIFAIILGLFTFAICGVGGNPVGLAIAIIASNMFVPLILNLEEYFLNLSLKEKYGTGK